MKHHITIWLMLAAIWYVLSGHTEALLIGLGLASVTVTVLLAWRMGVVDRESHPTHLGLGLIRFWAWLLWQIVLANVQVVRRILAPRSRLTPSVVTVVTRQRTDLGKVIVANAITLTPGTVTLDLHDDRLVVHALTEAAADDLRSGAMDVHAPEDAGEDA